MGYQQVRIVQDSEIANLDCGSREGGRFAAQEEVAGALLPGSLAGGKTTRPLDAGDASPEPGMQCRAEPDSAGTADLDSVPTELLTAAMQGDTWATARLFVMLRPIIHRFCRARLGHDRILVAPDDVVQEALLAIFTALPRYKITHGIPFRAFVLAIAMQKVVDAQRAAARNRTDLVTQPLDRLGPDENPPEQHALAAEQVVRLRRLLQTLPPQQRAVLGLRVVIGLSAHETARALGISAVAVRVAQHRALRALRSRLTDQDG
jgi:RNA polymerase sigma-70 factor, ECF subfamily